MRRTAFKRCFSFNLRPYYAVLVARKDTVSPLLCVSLAAVVNVVGDWLAVSVGTDR